MQAKAFYDSFVQTLREQYSAGKVHDGRFGALMDVSLVNDVRRSVPRAGFMHAYTWFDIVVSNAGTSHHYSGL